jgi:hypothetical protein
VFIPSLRPLLRASWPSLEMSACRSSTLHAVTPPIFNGCRKAAGPYAGPPVDLLTGLPTRAEDLRKPHEAGLRQRLGASEQALLGHRLSVEKPCGLHLSVRVTHSDRRGALRGV